MTGAGFRRQLAEARDTIRALQAELAETNSGLMALAMELETRVEARTAELRAAQEELAQSNLGLIQLSTELEDRVAQRTAELQAKDDEMRAMSEQLWQAAKLATVGELAASVAHELNNPLGTVTLRVEGLLEQVPPGDPRRQALAVIEREVERMANLVANLLGFSRREPPRVSTLDVREEIARTLELINHHLRKRSVTVVQQFASGVPMIHADRQQLRQLFLNLFTNASDAMPQGGTLTIRVQTRAPGSQPGQAPKHIVIEVADTGVGIPPENLPRVMEPFFTTKPEGKGTGLGLPICRRIVDGHHGTLVIDSEPGNGTTVRVVFPIANESNGCYPKQE